MNKLFALVFIFFACIGTSYSQDSIFFNKHALGVKIILLNTEEIRYRHFDSPEGPTYSQRIVFIDSIKYAKGREETLQSLPGFTKNPIQEKPKIRRLIFGLGLILGNLNTDNYNKFLAEHPGNNNINSKNSIGSFNVGYRAFTGYRPFKNFDFNSVIERASTESSEIVPFFGDFSERKLYFERISFGFIINKQIPLEGNSALNISAGPMYHKISINDTSGDSFNGGGWGYKLQAGFDIYAIPQITVRLLLGGEFAKISDNRQQSYYYTPTNNMNYSGLIFNLDILFNK